MQSGLIGDPLSTVQVQRDIIIAIHKLEGLMKLKGLLVNISLFISKIRPVSQLGQWRKRRQRRRGDEVDKLYVIHLF